MVRDRRALRPVLPHDGRELQGTGAEAPACGELGQQFGTGPRAKFLEWPWGQYANSTFDAVRKDGVPVGISVNPAYTVQAGGWFSVAVLDEAAAYGDEVVVTWGEPDGGTEKPTVEPHTQVEVRAVVATSPAQRVADAVE